ncbi:MAG: hypothetical protein R6W90_07735 [Ignavibacteriaceae bacterium]
MTVTFNGDAKIETGSFYAGLEFHHSSPLAQRISFYYPAANSIDLSTDYWKRDSTFIMALGLETDGVKEWIGHEKLPYTLTPYSVSFIKEDKDKLITISYKFCKDKPAFILSIEIKNLLPRKRHFKLLTDMEMSLRTSHSYKITSNASGVYDSSANSIFIDYNDYETQNVQLFAANAGDKPARHSANSVISSLPLEENKWWGDELWNFNDTEKKEDGIPAARYLYEKELEENESLSIIQVIGSAAKGEEREFVKYLLENYKEETDNFENYVINYAASNRITTGDETLDRSILWAKAVLAVNQHYIDGSIQPMPCPAEYNFYFTHDVLLTDLAAVYFDPDRVKKDLEFIISHADDSFIIPHAYYWKDSAYVTEYATPDNWNHFWFVIAAGQYMRKTHDTDFTKKLYPYIEKSISETMINRKDDLMFAFRPDWWDIGRNYGPRSFMTILAIKSLDEFINMSVTLNNTSANIEELKSSREKLHSGLLNKLWIDEKDYLMNYYEDGTLDTHYYIGSLVAAHFDLLDEEKLNKLTISAKNNILDPKLGVYTTFPMDIHKMIDYLKLAGNEAGDPYKYINGGIWQHGNAFYALALLKAGKKDEAIDFIKTTMTLDGVINSPNGFPAMYEYRNSNKNDPSVYGEIDKPQFMWAAGWYLYCIYEIYGK